MINQSEQLNSNPETVKLNQEFQLFKPNRTYERLNRDPDLAKPTNEYMSAVTLSLDDIPVPLPVEIYTMAGICRKGNCFTPFSPENGYQTDIRDWDLQQRSKKLTQLNQNLLKYVNFDQTPLYLRLRMWSKKLLSSGILREVSEGGHKMGTYDIRPTYEALFERLKIQLSFPDKTIYETLIKPNAIGTGGFYPADNGPLANIQKVTDTIFMNRQKFIVPDDSLAIMLPSNQPQLEQIRGRFVISPNVWHIKLD